MYKKCLKVYYQDLIETLLSNLIMIVIISVVLFLLQLPYYFYFINLIVFLYILIYFRREIKLYFKISNDILKDEIQTKTVVFDKIETDLVYGKPKRREFFKKYTTPRFCFYNEKDFYRIGMNLNNEVYSDIRGKTFEIKYCVNSRLIVEIKPLFKVDEKLKNQYKKVFGNINLD